MRIVRSMLSPAQIRMRRTGLTATDMSKLSGENPWGGPIDVWQAKREPEATALEKSVAPNNRALTGQLLEAAIAKRYVYEASRGSDLRIVQTATTYRHPQVQWALATPDRFIFKRPASDRISQASLKQLLKKGSRADWLLECKLVGSRVAKAWNLKEGDEPDCDRIPPYVYVQVQWQAFVLGYDIVDVAALLYGSTFKSFRIERDEEYIRALVAIGEAFWTKNVEQGQPPPPDGSDGYSAYLQSKYPSFGTTFMAAPEGAGELAAEYVRFREAESEAKKEKVKRGQGLRVLLRDAAGMEGPWGRVWWQLSRGEVDWKSIARDMAIGEDTIEKYRTEDRRSLKVNVTKKEGV